MAGGANVGIEWHKFDLSKKWLDRANPEMNQNPYLLRERERYLTWVGQYAESAQVAQQAIKNAAQGPRRGGLSAATTCCTWDVTTICWS